MRSSLALWYERTNAGTDYELPVELHFNLWRDIDIGANFFDVGILIKQPRSGTNGAAESVQSVSAILERFFLFIPGELNTKQFVDLSRILLHGQTLNAVFNDVVTVTTFADRYYRTTIAGKPHVTFHHIATDDDVEFQPVDMEHGRVGTLVCFRRSLCSRFSTSDDQYIRFRFDLDRHTYDLFTSESSPRDWFLLSSFSRTELTEFRLNERRSFPEAITTRIASAGAKYFRLETINYFLMRDRRFELIGAHTSFRKMRRLEQDLWLHYLRGIPPGGHLGRRVERSLRKASDRIIIYHWKSSSDFEKKEVLDDFIAFASFRAPIANLIIYAFVISFLGAVGAGLHPIGVEIFKIATTPFGYRSQPGILENAVPVFIFLLLAFLLPTAIKYLTQMLGGIGRVLSALAKAAGRVWRSGTGT
jgi:hypothetical protein